MAAWKTGHEFIDEIQQFKRLKTLYLYYDGNDLLKKVFSSSHNSIKLKQIQELKLYNKKSVLSTQESKPKINNKVNFVNNNVNGKRNIALKVTWSFLTR